MQSAVIIAAIALAVFLGYKTKINTGFFCIVFAYFIGCFWLDLKPKALIAFWPTNTMFVIISVSLLYNVAAANGTLEKISRSLLYACRKFPGMLPYALFAVAVILSVMGAALLHGSGIPRSHHAAHLRRVQDGQADRCSRHQLRRIGGR